MMTTKIGVQAAADYLNGAFQTGWIPGEQEDLSSPTLKKPVTVEYVAANQIKIVGLDWTDRIQQGTKIRYKQGDTYKYDFVSTITANTDTTLTLSGGSTVENEAITEFWFSNGGNPMGWPWEDEIGALEERVETLETDIEPAKLNFDVTQTVYAGSVDENGQPNFLTAGTGLSVNLSASVDDPVVIVFDYGINKYGTVCFSHEITANIEGAWSDLPANQTCYLYEDRNVLTGEFTRGYSLLAPNYVDRGNPSTTDDQHTFRIDKRKMYVGNGSEASVVQRVFVGECTTNADSVTSVVCYAIQGKYDSGWFTVSLDQEIAKSCNVDGEYLIWGYMRDSEGHKEILIDHFSYNDPSSIGAMLTKLDKTIYLRTGKQTLAQFLDGSTPYPYGFSTGQARIFAKRVF